MRHSFLWSSLICLSAATVSRSQAQSCVNLDRPAVFPAPTSLAAAQAELGRHGFLRDPSAGSEERYRGRAGRVVTLLSAGGRCFGSTLRIEAADLDAEFLQLARTLTGLGPPITGGLEGLAPIMDPKYLEHIPASKSDEKLLAWADTTNRLGLVMLILVRKRDRPPFRVEVARTVLGYQDSLSRAASFAEVVDTAKYAVVSDGQSRTLILKRSIRKVEPGAVRLTTLSSGLRGMPGSDLDRIEFDLSTAVPRSSRARWCFDWSTPRASSGLTARRTRSTGRSDPTPCWNPRCGKPARGSDAQRRVSAVGMGQVSACDAGTDARRRAALDDG